MKILKYYVYITMYENNLKEELLNS
jgi:hypothetical protein